jgi:hypothetical protein
MNDGQPDLFRWSADGFQTVVVRFLLGRLSGSATA